ncbi:formylmethanofuran dehydrogenase subunit C [Limnoglobus roseus]|uniref:Formylmethanofuran dehydrogenase subunit C n=1 Tax=Limnoglobus roseus TaxID=2598579 RepID=A0A5C1AJZ2_9BACT|nr:formylmethanofuran dehydrogenase subunit C [Limnoglobus roseus]QEL18012.1 formylmethanofuran dehydrogenase subunit C [Limnoglobus roseus]
MLTLSLKSPPLVPLEAEAISPDVLASLSLDEIRSRPVFLGKRQLPLDDLFTVEGSPGDEIELRGELTKVKWIGRGMSRGRLRIVGPVGMHLGAHMKGGTIEVEGDASDWLGAEMSGGLIRVRGNVGGQAGAAYRGAASGMSGGTILIDGTAGDELGMRMKRGTIAVRGPARDFAGLQMKGGTIILMSGAEQRTGAWMARGTIISLRSLELVPTFAFGCDIVPSFVRLYAKHFRPHGLELPVSGGVYQRYAGDLTGLGKGEILVWHPAAT